MKNILKRFVPALMLALMLVALTALTAAMAEDGGFNVEATCATSITVAPGEDVTLGVSVSGAQGDVTYQWLGQVSRSGNSTEYSPVEGATYDTLSLENITRATSYTCQVQDTSGNAEVVYFSINIANEFNACAVSDTMLAVAPGGEAEMAVSAFCSQGDVTYQWFEKEYDEYNYPVYVPIPDATGSSYNATGISPPTEYFCSVADKYDNYKNVWFYIDMDNGFYAEAVGDTNIAVVPGENATMTVNASCVQGDVTYQWYEREYGETGYSDVLIPDATTSSYTAKDISSYTEYYCYVEDSYGNWQSVPFSIFIENGFSAEAVGNNSIAVAPGADATMTVSASCTQGTLTYQWYGRQYDESGNYSHERIPGATDPSFTARDISAYTDFYCRVEDMYRNRSEIWFSVSIDNGFTAVADGNDEITIALGEDVTMAVNASCAQGGLTYQWYGRHLNEDGEYDYQPIPNATESSHTATGISSYTDFYCHVEDSYGGCQDVWFSISIANGLSAEPVGDDSVAVAPGADATLAVSASCTQGTLTYQWYSPQLDEDGEYRMKPIPGATESSHTATGISSYTEYYCRVMDMYQNSRIIWFYVRVDNGFTAEADGDYSIAVAPGADATMTVNASCEHGELTYQWYGRQYDEDGNYSHERIPDATGASHTAQGINQYTSFYCHVEDEYGSTADIWFYVSIDNNFSAGPDGRGRLGVAPGGSATMRVKASCSSGKLSYAWYSIEYDEYGNSIATSIPDVTGSSCTVENVLEAQDYRCVVRDEYGAESSVDFSVYVDNGFYARRVGSDEISLLAGESATLQVNAHCNQGQLTYQWYGRVYDDYGDYDYAPISGATGAAYTTEALTAYTRFYCRVEDQYRNSSELDFYIDIDNGLCVSENTIDLTVSFEQSARLEVSAWCDNGELSYSWSDSDDNMIEDADSAVYITGPIREQCAYSCRVEDDFGHAENVYFYISVENNFTAGPVGEARIVRDLTTTQTLSVSASCATGNLKYEWRIDNCYDSRKGSWLYDEELSDVTGPTLTLPEFMMQGCLSCVVEDDYGNSRSIGFEVDPPATFKATREGSYLRRLSAGEQATLKVNVTGMSEGLTYQWYGSSSDEPIAGATGASYQTPALTASAEYACTITSIYGQKKTLEFQCLVNIPVLSLDTPVKVAIDSGRRFYAFTPEVTDIYTLESSGSLDTCATLYTLDLEELAYNDDIEGDEGNYNFRLACQLTAGTQYYYEVSAFEEDAAEFTMKLTRGGTVEPPHSSDGTIYLLPGQTVETHFHGCDLERMTSSNPSVLSVSGNRITAVAPGTAELEAEYVCETYYDLDVVVVNANSFSMPAGLREIQSGAFAGDTHLEYLDLSANVESVGSDAFNGSGLKLLVVNGRGTRLRGCSLRGIDDLTVICHKGSAAASYAGSQENCWVLYFDD